MKTPDDPLALLRSAILSELAPRDDLREGWVVIDSRGDDQGRSVVIGWTFDVDRAASWTKFIDWVDRGARNDVHWTVGYPVDGSREQKLRWLRRKGFKVKRAKVELVTPPA